MRHFPHVILTAAELRETVKGIEREREFVIDVETTSARKDNELLWIGIGVPGGRHLIPVGHPKGITLEGAHKEKTPAFVFYPEGDERRLTKLGKPSFRMIEHTVPARFAPPPQQMFPHQACEILQPLLFSDRAKIGHNVKFDLMTLGKYYDGEIPPPPYHDTMLMEHCLDEGYGEEIRPFSLKDVIYAEFRIKPADRQKFYPSLGKQGVVNFGLDQVARYLAKDLHFCRYLFKAHYKWLGKDEVLAAYDAEMQLYPAIMGMEYAGFPVDLSKMDEVRQSINKQLRLIETEVWDTVGDEFPLTNYEAKRWILFGEGDPVQGDANKAVLATQKLPVLLRTKVNQEPSVTQAVLKHYADKGNQLASLFLDWSMYEKLRGTFIEGLSKFLIDGGESLPTLHTSFKQHGTKTGRLSAAEPNLQQLPKGSTIRQLFVADDDEHVLIVADYDQIELRCAGYLSRDPAMLDVFARGEDIHRRAAAVMYRVAPEEVTEAQRGVGKTQNFAVLYGAGEEKIAQIARCSLRRASLLVRNYYAEFAGLEPWKARLIRDAMRLGNRNAPGIHPPYVLIPPFGRRRRIPDLFHPDYGPRKRAERQAVNAQVQGFAASITKLAMMELHVKLPEHSSCMLAQVHDEIVVRAPKDKADEVMALVNGTMSGVIDPRFPLSKIPILEEVPLVVSVASGHSWAEAKGKG